nr:hypothetical protein CFP56_76315 [Quercus suber]
MTVRHADQRPMSRFYIRGRSSALEASLEASDNLTDEFTSALTGLLLPSQELTHGTVSRNMVSENSFQGNMSSHL